ncbi:SDR family NAD(P)-dependent oxidoreductase [Nocardia sp. NPDC051030]|uniref:SDR family NAD(P)-dependent oxidoreductase n=1 Tax=Nocardia sp. NPDC051030 TaxID=3155162 RepID=UPI003416F366
MTSSILRRIGGRRGRGLPIDVARYWEGRHVVVTGGSSGIGLEVTRSALAAGARVSVLALGDQALTELPTRMPAAAGRLAVIAADVSQAEQTRAAVELARERHGRIAALIVCAGIAKPDYFSRLAAEDFDKHMAVNYFGALNVIRDVLPDLRGRDRDSITVISSMAGVLPCFGYGAYSPSKFAVSALCEVLRQELKPTGVMVTVVLPPDVDTPQLAAEAATKPPELAALNASPPMPATAVARALLAGAARGRPTVIPSARARLIRRLTALAPHLTARLIDTIIARTQRELPLAERTHPPRMAG